MIGSPFIVAVLIGFFLDQQVKGGYDTARVVESNRYAPLRDHTMIRCKPKGICSWNFFLDGEDHHAYLEFNWRGEQGAITADDTSFEVRKHDVGEWKGIKRLFGLGIFSGHWTLDLDRESVASAQKSSAFTRTFEIQNAEGTLLLCAESAGARNFRVERSDEVMATISRDHALTRRATIETLAEKWDFPTICFAFWLVVLIWHRAASGS